MYVTCYKELQSSQQKYSYKYCQLCFFIIHRSKAKRWYLQRWCFQLLQLNNRNEIYRFILGLFEEGIAKKELTKGCGSNKRINVDKKKLVHVYVYL